MKATKTWVLIVLLLIPAINAHAWPWPDTGQTKCYGIGGTIPHCPFPDQRFYGQDAQYKGPTRSYTKLGQSGVVLPDTATREDGWIMTRDHVTGLIWEDKYHSGNPDDKYDSYYYWCDTNPKTNGGFQGYHCDGRDNTESFIKVLNDTKFGGFSDWRLPKVYELSSLQEYSHYINSEPSVDNDWFPHHQGGLYWSSTAKPDDKYLSYSVSFNMGGVYAHNKHQRFHAIAVRADGSARAALVDNGNGTVTDTSTGLTWQKATAPGTYTWKEALAYCESLNLAGYTDWRLPNINELNSLVYYSRFRPAIDPVLVSSTRSDLYWSSTTNTYYTDNAELISFEDGKSDHGDTNRGNGKEEPAYVRAVRAGQSGLLSHLFISTVNVAAPWTLTGPNSFTQTGKGDLTLTNLAPGDYTITWGDVNGWTKPSPATSTQTLTAGGTITFIGTYRKVGLPWLPLILAD